MFRRKEEESLFDTNAAPGQAQPESQDAQQISQPSGYAPVPPQQSRFAPESRPNAAPQSSFRPGNSPLPSDMTRSRMPEAKPAASAGSPVSATVEKTGKAIRRVLTVGSDILLKGEIATCDRLVIEGKVDATLNDVHTVEITETGSFKGSAHIEDAEISGLFEGDLVVRNRLVIYSTGKVRGKISYGEIEIERGGELTGEIKIGGAQNVPSRAPNRVASKEAA